MTTIMVGSGEAVSFETWVTVKIDGMTIVFVSSTELKVVWTYKGKPVIEQLSHYVSIPGSSVCLDIERGTGATFTATMRMRSDDDPSS
jgi:hypothetical protein